MIKAKPKPNDDTELFFDMYHEFEIEAESLEEAEAKALCLQSQSNHKDLMAIIEVKKYVPT